MMSSAHRPVTVMTRREFLCEDNSELATDIVNKKSRVVMVSYVCDCVDFWDAIVLWLHLLMFCSCPDLRPQPAVTAPM